VTCNSRGGNSNYGDRNLPGPCAPHGGTPQCPLSSRDDGLFQSRGLAASSSSCRVPDSKEAMAMKEDAWHDRATTSVDADESFWVDADDSFSPLSLHATVREPQGLLTYCSVEREGGGDTKQDSLMPKRGGFVLASLSASTTLRSLRCCCSKTTRRSRSGDVRF
jgi:hypothetical protein